MPRAAAVAVGFVVAFVVGIAVGRSLGDNPDTGRQQTLVRTLRPLPLAPAARSTVTITVQNK
ncbi:MAG: hypothetical protein ACJ77E_12770 [Gaiellaceae bacterium]